MPRRCSTNFNLGWEQQQEEQQEEQQVEAGAGRVGRVSGTGREKLKLERLKLPRLGRLHVQH